MSNISKKSFMTLGLMVAARATQGANLRGFLDSTTSPNCKKYWASPDISPEIIDCVDSFIYQIHDTDSYYPITSILKYGQYTLQCDYSSIIPENTGACCFENTQCSSTSPTTAATTSTTTLTTTAATTTPTTTAATTTPTTTAATTTPPTTAATTKSTTTAATTKSATTAAVTTKSTTADSKTESPTKNIPQTDTTKSSQSNTPDSIISWEIAAPIIGVIIGAIFVFVTKVKGRASNGELNQPLLQVAPAIVHDRNNADVVPVDANPVENLPLDAAIHVEIPPANVVPVNVLPVQNNAGAAPIDDEETREKNERIRLAADAIDAITNTNAETKDILENKGLNPQQVPAYLAAQNRLTELGNEFSLIAGAVELQPVEVFYAAAEALQTQIDELKTIANNAKPLIVTEPSYFGRFMGYAPVTTNPNV